MAGICTNVSKLLPPLCLMAMAVLFEYVSGNLIEAIKMSDYVLFCGHLAD